MIQQSVSTSAPRAGEGGLGGGDHRNRRRPPSLLLTLLNYLCLIIFFILLLFHLTYSSGHLSWFIVFSPLVPVYLGLLYSHTRDISLLHPNTTQVMRTKCFCSIADSISYLVTSVLLLFNLLKLPSAPVPFFATLTPLCLISSVTITIRFQMIPSPLSREWNQGELTTSSISSLNDLRVSTSLCLLCSSL